jgi:uncharacterized membrane protein
VSDLYYLYLYILAPILAFVSIILTLIRIGDYIFPQRKEVKPYPSSANIKILQLRRTASGMKSWNRIKMVSIVLSALMLVPMLLAVGLLAYAMVKHDLPVSLNAPSVFLLVVMLGLPIYLLVSTIRDDKRSKKGIRSRVAEPAELELLGENQVVVMDQCQRTLSAMGARITHLDAEQGTIEAELNRNRVTIQITKTQDMHYKASIISDAMWPSVRFDFGANKRIVNNLIRML